MRTATISQLSQLYPTALVPTSKPSVLAAFSQRPLAFGHTALLPGLEAAPPFFTQIIAAYVKAHATQPPIMLTIGMPDIEPPETFQRALQHHATQPGSYYYAQMGFIPELSEAYLRWFQHRFGVSLSPEQLLPYAGSNEGIMQLLHGVIAPHPDDTLWTPDPYYPTFHTAQKFSTWKTRLAPITPKNHYQFNYENAWKALSADEKQHTKAIVLTYPNNPTGAQASKEYLENVVAFAKKNNLLIINDLAYADIYPAHGKPPISLFELPEANDARIIELHSFSKSLAIPGARVGIALFSKPLLAPESTEGQKKSLYQAALEYRAHMHATGIFPLVQRALADTLNDTATIDAYLAHNRQRYQQRADLFRGGLEQLGWTVANAADASTPFYLWVNVPDANKSSVEFSNEVIEKTGVAMIPGSYFGPSGEGYLRVSMTQPQANLTEALRRLKNSGYTYPKPPPQ